MIGIELAAKAPADGYTILMAASTLAINPIMYKNVPYDPVRDFAADHPRRRPCPTCWW